MAPSNDSGQQTTGAAHHPRHLPIPIITSASRQSPRNGVVGGIMEPRPPKPTLPSLDQVLDRSERGSSFDAPSFHNELTPRSTPTLDGWRGLPDTPRPAFDADAVMKKVTETMNAQLRANGHDPDNLPVRKPLFRDPSYFSKAPVADNPNEDLESNPYQERADEIGLSHRIPGIGHLGDLLTPLGWKSGDGPIKPTRARQLQKIAYHEAKKKLDDSIAEFKHLKGTAFREASDLKNEEWQNQTELNKLIFEERVNIYQAHEERNKNGFRQGRPQQQVPVLNLPPSNSAGPYNAATAGVVPPSYQMSRPAAPRRLDLLTPVNGSDKPEPSPRLLSPSFLDPNLVPGTVQAVIQGYNDQKLQLRQLHHENELRLRQCLHKYGPHLGPRHQIRRQSQADAEQPLQQDSSTLKTFDNGHSDGAHNESQGLTAYHYPSPPGQNALGIYEEPSDLALTPMKNQGRESTPQPTEGRARLGAQATTQPKKRTTTKKATLKKEQPWYASYLSAANLPTSTITAEAIQAGLAYDPKDPARAASSQTPKKRRRGSEPVPVPEFKMSADKIRALFKSGLPVRYTGPGPNPYLEDEGAGGESKGEASAAPENGGKKDGKPKGKGKAKVGASVESPLFVDDQRSSDHDLDTQDDSADGSYGVRRKPRAGATPRKGKPTANKRMRREEEG
ncbi:MAG: hypothetical protein Q9170_000688 [Blastenia crenularia]